MVRGNLILIHVICKMLTNKMFAEWDLCDTARIRSAHFFFLPGRDLRQGSALARDTLAERRTSTRRGLSDALVVFAACA